MIRPTPSRPGLRRVARVILTTGLAVALFVGFVIAGLLRSTQPAAAVAAVAPHPSPGLVTEGRIVVAVVLGRSGSDTADVLAPYEVFARSDAFAVYTVAETRDPAALDGGLAVRPDHTFDEVDTGRAPAPDLVVVPAVEEPDGAIEQAARDFIVRRHEDGAHILGICAGSRLLAATGVLDGRRATSHWSRIAALEASRPDVDWVRGQRWVTDGPITTTGGVTSSIPGSLHVMAELVGDEEARRVGDSVAYPGWSIEDLPHMAAHSFGPDDAGVLANMLFPWGRPTYDIELRDGVGEIDAAALFEVYAYSQAADTRAISSTGTVVTRHGLTLVTQAVGAAIPANALRAGEAAADGSTGFDAAFGRLQQSAAPSVVASVGRMLEYPLDRVATRTTAESGVWRSTAVALVSVIASVVGAVLVGLGMPRLLRTITSRRSRSADSR